VEIESTLVCPKYSMKAMSGYTTCYYCGCTHLEVQNYQEAPKSTMDDESWKGLPLFLFFVEVVSVAFLVIAFNMFTSIMTSSPNAAKMKGGGDGSGLSNMIGTTGA
jgi:hypothetical protein